MQFTKTDLEGAFLIKTERIADNRGYFSTLFAVPDFEAQGLNAKILQASTSFNNVRGTVRGMHWQIPPLAETKLVRCARGAILDVIVDLRSDSPTFKRWQGFELTDQNMHMLYIPEGFAHGYQTLTDEAEVSYLLGQVYSPNHARGLRHDDPEVSIKWPAPVAVISPRDAALPLFSELKASELDLMRRAVVL